jgi:hypothetical protein
MVCIEDMKVDTSMPVSRQLLIACSLLFATKGQGRLAKCPCGLWPGGTAGHITASPAVWPLAAHNLALSGYGMNCPADLT